MDDITTTTPTDFRLTGAAIDRVSALLESETGNVFRVAVLGGGCSGFQYSFSIENTPEDDDRVLDLADSAGKPVRVVVDDMSLELLAGSELDYVQELIGSYFQVSNPNATASCGCGTSFAI